MKNFFRKLKIGKPKNPAMDQRDFQALKTRIPGQVSDKVRETVEKLDRLWQTMGFSIDEKNERTDMITYHFNELAEKMLSEETEVKIKLKKSFPRPAR